MVIEERTEIAQQRILVTGGAGFIGSHLIDVLLANQATVWTIDNLSFGKRAFLPPDGTYFRFIEGDLLDQKVITKVFQTFQPTWIYHLAAIHHIPTCEVHPIDALRTNVEGTQVILQAISQAKTIEKIVFTSSGAVYDVLNLPLTEDSPVVPYDIYSISKVTGEHLLRVNALRTGIPTVVARMFNVVGARETNAHLVPDILAQVVKGERNIQLGNLKPRRSYIHVMDAAEALFALGKVSLSCEYDVFNVGVEEEYTVQDILDLLGGLLNYELIPLSTEQKARKIDRISQQAVIQKIMQETGWHPKSSLRDALKYALQEVNL